MSYRVQRLSKYFYIRTYTMAISRSAGYKNKLFTLDISIEDSASKAIYAFFNSKILSHIMDDEFIYPYGLESYQAYFALESAKKNVSAIKETLDSSVCSITGLFVFNEDYSIKNIKKTNINIDGVLLEIWIPHTYISYLF